jgi:agmatine/peptidylarginine deiminase
MKTFITFCFFLLYLSFWSYGQLAVVTPAEFEKNEGVLLVWDYSQSRDSITANITRIAQQAGKVWIIYYPGTAPVDTAQIRSYLYSRGVSPSNLYFIPGWTETLWIRDFGPLFGYGYLGTGLERFIYDAGYAAYNRPKDDSIPRQISRVWEIPFSPLSLEVEGGNLIFDGLARGFGSKRIWEQNPGLNPDEIREMLMEKFNLTDFMFLDNLNNSGGGIWKHVDMYMKVIDYETILVSSYPDYLPDYGVIEATVELLESTNTFFGKPYKVIRIPAPPKADGSWSTTQNDEMRTYTNSLIINNTVIVPSYNLPEWDNNAKAIYTAAMPGYTVEMVDSRMLTILGGAVHCITREVPAQHFSRIIHEKVAGAIDYTESVNIHCQATSDTLVQTMWLYYRNSGEEQFTKTAVQLTCPTHYGTIPNIQPTDTIDYYLELITYNDSITYPLSAPEGYFTFWFNSVGQNEVSIRANRLTIFPNPSDGNFRIKSEAQPDLESIISITDVSGRLVYTCGITGYADEICTGLDRGTYIMSVKTETVTHQFVFIVQ